MASSRLALTDGECNPSAPSKGQFHSPSIPRPVLTYDECNPSALLTVSYLTLPALRKTRTRHKLAPAKELTALGADLKKALKGYARH